VIAAYQKCGSKNELVRAAIEPLRRWNGQMDKDQAAPMMTELLNNRLASLLVTSILPPASRKAIQQRLRSEPESPQAKTGARARGVPASGSATPDILPRPFVIARLLHERPHGWVAKDDWDGWLLDNLQSALEEGRARQGTPVSNWRWGRMLEWNLAHPIGKELPLVARYFDIGPVPMSGSSTTVKQTTGVLGPSERMVVDLGDLDKSVQNLQAGESGLVLSRHYKDQWPAYYAGTSFPMQFDHVDAKEVLQVRPQH
jgi:penicillin amidase